MNTKIIISFECDADTRDFIRKRAAMTNRSVSGYLRELVKDDRQEWEQLAANWWSKQIKQFENMEESHGEKTN